MGNLFSRNRNTQRPANLGELKASGWESIPVKEELRRNLVARIRNGDSLFSGVHGYEETVMPQLENAILAGHDVIFLGERGQAKTRLIRGLVQLLDEWMPVVAGSEINDDPFSPVSKHAKDLISQLGQNTPIEWVHRDLRYGEKLATPDTSIADLIGEVDPIKVAEGRYLSDELTLHYGLVPRTNRGLFAINELPDLAERIQVGLLNVLEERDIQIRGYKIRLPLDVVLFASANPEDYTNRGRIITPLKDRFGSQIRTHYPTAPEIEMDIVEQEASIPSVGELEVNVPNFMTRVIAVLTQEARNSPHLNQRSGVSVRMSVTNQEAMIANSVRRALRNKENEAVPRISDLNALIAATAGKVEIESLDEERDSEIVNQLLNEAVLNVFRDLVPSDLHQPIIEAFENLEGISTGEDIKSDDYQDVVSSKVPALKPAVEMVLEGNDSNGSALTASAVELILEGLHLSKRLNKYASGARANYAARQ
ncbi:MAG: magnesium chelatase [Actinomycetota bacterium]|nr:magnesium chelatase [Acidimicrobiales bacterium]MEC7899034.1 magnesium chelatase [Actinomycetota bacterium]|tara:strand:+ start:422 stop:1864 length:1443 start_codon:yes stop_codon:yes gene_type:complete